MICIYVVNENFLLMKFGFFSKKLKWCLVFLKLFIKSRILFQQKQSSTNLYLCRIIVLQRTLTAICSKSYEYKANHSYKFEFYYMYTDDLIKSTEFISKIEEFFCW